jgi:acyl-CoA synthetase (AMP-forming)/AMP-acid ligase II
MTPQEKVDCLTRLSGGFVQNYGSTMAGMITVLASHEVAAHSESVGRPMDQVLVEIVDDEGRPLPRGDVGVIRVRTPGVARELVLEGLEARSSDLVVDGWIYPGDIGRLDSEGFLSIVGRTSDVIIRGGVNVYPSEIEAVLVSHPAVREAAVVGWPDRVLGEEIAAFVTLSTPVNPRELAIYCAGKLHPDKHPRQVFVIDEMPRNANGKLVRRDLLARLPDRPSN